MIKKIIISAALVSMTGLAWSAVPAACRSAGYAAHNPEICGPSAQRNIGATRGERPAPVASDPRSRPPAPMGGANQAAPAPQDPAAQDPAAQDPAAQDPRAGGRPHQGQDPRAGGRPTAGRPPQGQDPRASRPSAPPAQ